MNSQAPDLPEKLDVICEDFSLCEGREKLELLLQYADSLPTIPDGFDMGQGEMEDVPECMTPVRIHAKRDEWGMQFFFEIPASSPTARGFACLLSSGLEGLPPQEILQVRDDFYRCTGLETALSFQRMQGFSAILAHMKRLALANLEAESCEAA